MQKSEKFFIFSWKELLVIGLLVLTLVGFFFTLGLHYGKNLHPVAETAEVADGKLEESPENVPSREALDKGAQTTEGAAKDAIKTATEGAVADTNLKVDQSKPVDLPADQQKTQPTGIAAPKAGDEAANKDGAKASDKPAEKTVEKAPEKPVVTSPATPHFAVQLGSYTLKKEAQQKIAVLSKRGLKPEIRMAVVNGETHYRVVLAGFKSRPLADQKGRELKSKRKIENFVVIKAD